MTKFAFDNHVGKVYSIETTIVPGTTSRGTVEIMGSCRSLGWGKLTVGDVTNFQLFDLVLDRNGKPTDVNMKHVVFGQNSDGSPKLAGTEHDARLYFEVMQGQMIENEKLKEVKAERQKKLAELGEARNQRAILVKNKRAELEEEVRKLSAGKTIEEMLKDKELLSLATEFSLFNFLFPPRAHK